MVREHPSIDKCPIPDRSATGHESRSPGVRKDPSETSAFRVEPLPVALLVIGSAAGLAADVVVAEPVSAARVIVRLALDGGADETGPYS
jgi:hypothetical protein